MTPLRRLALSTFLIGIGMIAFPTYAYAQNINGIFGIRSSEQFFQDGIERFERHIEVLQDGFEDETALTLDESIEEQRQRIEEEGLPAANEATDTTMDNRGPVVI